VEDGVVGSLVPFDDAPALLHAVDAALARDWDETALRAYALRHSWDDRAALLCEEFKALVAKRDEIKRTMSSRKAGV
ncbi:MAG TPA: hypothetical protein VJM53_06350, partial [Burkholderiales bacterium]|nr:hypothetical protein [Burkholderiales bacterium]